LRIGIDGHAIGAHKTGNETYTFELVKGLTQLAPNGYRYFIYLTNSDVVANPPFQATNFSFRCIRPSFPALRIPLGFPVESRLRHLDLFHAQYFLPPNLGCRTVLTVHDIGFETYPELYDKKYLFWFRSLIPRSCERADHIIAVSEFTRRDLIRKYHLPPGKIAVTYCGIGGQYRPMDEGEARRRVLQRYGIADPFILYVGNLQPRKNLRNLIRAFSRLRRRHSVYKLVLAGQKAFEYAEIFRSVRDTGLEDSVFFPGYVSSTDLPLLYAAAAVFVYPSIFEGFGLPVIEAMACGAPTITSHGSSLEEVAGDGAELVDPLDVDQIHHAMERVLLDSNFRADLRERGLRRAAAFTSRNLGAETLRIYELVIGR
jgi:glycosyltransferase involved in cell wall biosynthesis